MTEGLRPVRPFLIVSLLISLIIAVHFIPPLTLVRPFSAKHLGLRYNWIWPLDCVWMAYLFSRLTGTPLRYADSSAKRIVGGWCLGMSAGVGLQTTFWLLGLRRGFHFRGVEGELLAFQTLESYAEELLFRGAFQNYLGRRWLGESGKRFTASLIAGLFISIEFGLIHGLNPILAGRAGFDWGWFVGTFFLSLLSSLAFASSSTLPAPYGVHLAFNYISNFF